MAVPFAVAHCTDEDAPVAPARVIVKVADLVPELPSATVTSLMLKDVSSLTMVPSPDPSAMVAPTGAESTATKLSFGSPTVSPFTVTETVFVVSPGPKLTDVGATATKSVPARAVLLPVAQVTDEVPVFPDRVMVKVAAIVPELPSVTVTSLMRSDGIDAANVTGVGADDTGS